VLGSVEPNACPGDLVTRGLGDLSTRLSTLLCFASLSCGSMALLSGFVWIESEGWTFTHWLALVPAQDEVAVNAAASTACGASSPEAGGGALPSPSLGAAFDVD